MASQLDPKLTGYLLELERSHHPMLLEMESIAFSEGFPIIGAQCGRVLATLALAIRARRVFEMGSGFGYSTLWFALAIGENGEVVHTDGDAKNTKRAKYFLDRAGVLERCRFVTGDAIDALHRENEMFDVILIDIDKQDYPKALEIAIQKIRVGGLILTHNVLWSGRVVDVDDSPATAGIKQYNQAIMESPELLSFIDPIDDGLAVSLKVAPSTKAHFFRNH
jgi:caffeoyl-CoA O-methyltransferase